MVIRLALFLVLMCSTARGESLRLIVPDIHPVVGEMIPLTIRGEYTGRIALESLTFPDSGAYDWVQLARDQWRNERVEGRAVKVFERRLALFPRHAGPVTIGPLTHRLTVVTSDGGREVLDVQAAPLTINIATFPAKGLALAAKSLIVEDDLSTAPGKLLDGETLIRRVTLRAEGTLPHLLPPRPVIRQPWLISFTAPEIRKVKPTPQGPETTIVWEWHLRPKTGEPGVLPPFEIPWFDTGTRRLRKAEIPAIPFGYASFSTNVAGTSRLSPSQKFAAFGALGAGLVTGLLFVSATFSLRRSNAFLRVLKRCSPINPTRRKLKAAAKQQDLMALRSAVERYLERRRELGLPDVEGATARLDQAIYGEPSASQTFDPQNFVRALLRRRTTRPAKCKNAGL
jgi:hypothetical protein